MSRRADQNAFPNPLNGNPGLSIREYAAIKLMAASIESDSHENHSLTIHADFAVRGADVLLDRLKEDEE